MPHRETSEQERKRVHALRTAAQRYRSVFSGADGEFVLMDILNELRHYDCEDVSHETLVLQRAARRMLARMQVIHDDNVAKITSAYLEVPMPQLPKELQ